MAISSVSDLQYLSAPSTYTNLTIVPAEYVASTMGVELWSAKTFAKDAVVVYNGNIYTATQQTAASDIPGVSNKWGTSQGSLYSIAKGAAESAANSVNVQAGTGLTFGNTTDTLSLNVTAQNGVSYSAGVFEAALDSSPGLSKSGGLKVVGAGNNISVGDGVSASIPQWTAQTDYIAGDVVYFSSVIYVCKPDKAHKSGESFDTTEKANWTAISSTITSNPTATATGGSGKKNTYVKTNTKPDANGTYGYIDDSLLPLFVGTDPISVDATYDSTTGRTTHTVSFTRQKITEVYVVTSYATDKSGSTTDLTAGTGRANVLSITNHPNEIQAGDVVIEQPTGSSAKAFMYVGNTVADTANATTIANTVGKKANWIELTLPSEYVLTSDRTSTITAANSTSTSAVPTTKAVYDFVTGVGGITGLVSGGTMTVSVDSASTADYSTGHYVSETKGIVQLASYCSTDVDNKGYWVSGNATGETLAATPAGVAAFINDRTCNDITIVSNNTTLIPSMAVVQGISNALYNRSRGVFQEITVPNDNGDNRTVSFVTNIRTNADTVVAADKLLVQVYQRKGVSGSYSYDLVLVDTTITPFTDSSTSPATTNSTITLHFASAPSAGTVFRVCIYPLGGNLNATVNWTS